MLDNEQSNTSTAVEMLEFITLSVGGQWFCVPTRFIQEIRQWSPVTYLPGASDVVYGAINLRGTVLPIVDLAAVLGLEPQTPTERNAVVVTKRDTKMGGYLVSNASKLIKVASDEIQPPPDIDEQSTSKFCSGTLFIEEEMIQVLAIDKLFPFGDEKLFRVSKHERDIGPPLTLSDKEFQSIANFADEGFGLVLDMSKKNMVFRRLSPRIRKLGLKSFAEYTKRLSDDETERLNLLSLLTTNLTHFFREKHHFDLMRKVALPHLTQRLQTGGRVRMWSCACSSGEEPYSIAMEVCEGIPNATVSNLKILATDIDPEILHRAENGSYNQDQIKGVPANLRSKYFNESNDGDLSYAIKPQIKKMIGFGQLNLPGEWPFQGEFDVIFCRNVAIYFSQETQEKLWMRLVDRLPSGALLFIGHSERIAPSVAGKLRLLGRTAYQKI